MRRYPGVALRAYGSYDGSIRDLEFLRFFPGLRRFSVDALYELESLHGLRHLGEGLVSLVLGRTRRRLSLEQLERFPELRLLYLEGHSKDISSVATLRQLRSLTLRSITVPDLDLFSPLSKLKALDLKLGGTKNLDSIGAFRDLRYLELWMVRGLDDLRPIANAARLEMLFLQALKNVTEFPNLGGLTNLKRVHLETMRGLTDLRPLLDVRSLEELDLVDMRQLTAEQVGVLAEHESLTGIRIGLGSTRKNDAARALVGLPDTTFDRRSYLASLLE